jgi:hypothetical protein
MRLIHKADGRIVLPSSPSSSSEVDIYDDELFNEGDIITNSHSGSDISEESTEEMSDEEEVDESSRDGDSTSSELEDEYPAFHNFDEDYSKHTFTGANVPAFT